MIERGDETANCSSCRMRSLPFPADDSIITLSTNGFIERAHIIISNVGGPGRLSNFLYDCERSVSANTAEELVTQQQIILGYNKTQKIWTLSQT